MNIHLYLLPLDDIESWARELAIDENHIPCGTVRCVLLPCEGEIEYALRPMAVGGLG